MRDMSPKAIGELIGLDRGVILSQGAIVDTLQVIQQQNNELRMLEKESNPLGLSPQKHLQATRDLLREIQRVGLLNVDESFMAPFRDPRKS